MHAIEKIPVNDFAQSTYEYLHSIPELGFEEKKTSKFIAEKLREFGYFVTENIGTTGVLGILDSGVDGLCFGLRADMDALPFIVDGKEIASHACGHDANSAMVLACAKSVAEKGISKGKFAVIFQQAEEKIGAVPMIEAFDFSFIEELIGIHLRPNTEAKMGEAMHALCHSASCFAKIRIAGKTAHGARPHLGVNAINIATSIIEAVNAMRLDPSVPHSVKATQIESVGNPPNSIPHDVSLTLDMRALDNRVMDEIKIRVGEIAQNSAKMHGGEIVGLEINGVIASEYDEDVKELCKKAVVSVLGSTLGEKATTGGEDFHYFGKMCNIKTGYIGLGANLTPGVHCLDMNFDKRALDIGVAILEKAVELKFS